jgi:hypothetical protein
MKPPVAAKVDLRAFAFMPLVIAELFNSDTWLLACRNPFAAAACINLWGRAWHQVPAGSLPDDEALLAGYAGVPDWAAVRDIALRGFVKADDGRLYHTVLCRKVKKAWAERRSYAAFCKAQRERGAKGNANRWKTKKKLDPPQGDRHGDPHRDRRRDRLKGEGEGEGKGEAPLLKNAPPILDAEPDAGEPDEPNPPSPDDGTRLPPDWRLDPEGRAFAAGLGYADAAIDFLAAQFADYWRAKPGDGARKRDWGLTWQVWCRNYRGPAGPGGAGGLEALRGGPPGGGVVAALGEVRASRERPGVVGKPRLRF